MNGHYVRSQTHIQQWMAAEEEVRAHQTLYEGGAESLDILLDSQRRRTQAQYEYYNTLIEYNKWLAQVHFRKGSLLEHDAVWLGEGPWPEKAYWDALGLARERDASYYLDYGWTRPKVISQGPVNQQWNEQNEQVPTPTPNANPQVNPNGGPQPTPATPSQDPMQPMQAQPITSAPNLLGVPALGAMISSGDMPLSAKRPVSSFDWGDLGLPATSKQQGASASAVQPATYSQPVE